MSRMLKVQIFILAFLHLGCHGLHSDMLSLSRCRTIIKDERLFLQKKIDFTCLKQVRGGADEVDNIEVTKNKIVQLYISYMKSLDKHPVRTKSITAGIVLAVGDLLAQSIESRVARKPSFNVNWTRLNAFLLTGGLYVGPFVHYWFELLWMMGRWLERNHDVSKGWQTMVQLFTDQTIGIAIFFPPYFYIYELFEAFVGLRAPHFTHATTKVKEEIWDLFMMQYRIWPITNWLSFTYVPENLRVLTSNLISVFWNAYLCSKIAG
mmetsp:Transcript_14661/g.26599  ORF Transcript_14661/g.26599 Transcript_14661/m.26599 type:complete len:264 (-) Transcript_14661:1194-1985(-)